MKKILVLSAFALLATAQVASADRGRHRGHWKHRERPAATWSGGVSVTTPRVVVQPRVVVKSRPVYVQRPRVVRRPIYVQAPVIQYRYTNYYQRPSVLVENYPAQTGYYWVAGSWSWNGYEWTWTAGHYEPDPNYVEQSYDSGYNYDYSYQSPSYSTSTQVQSGPGYSYGYSYQSPSVGVSAHVHSGGCH